MKKTLLISFLALAALFPVQTEAKESVSYSAKQSQKQENSKKSKKADKKKKQLQTKEKKDTSASVEQNNEQKNTKVSEETDKKEEQLSSKMVGTTQIIGNDEFIKRTEAALVFIRDKAPTHYEMVTNYVLVIQAAKASGMRPFGKLPTYKVGVKTAYSSVTWYASTIVHDSYHSKLYNDYRKKFNCKVPHEIWGGREPENACLSAQEEFLKKVNANPWLVSYVQKMRNVDYFSKSVERTW